MGTDIHGLIETQDDDGSWHMIYVLRSNDIIERRDYEVFAALAGVRGEGPKAKGFPIDLSPEARWIFDNSGDHTPSWVTVAELVEVMNTHGPPSPVERRDIEYWLGCFRIRAEDRFVFWFDS